MNGYRGMLLEVNLTNGEIKKSPLNQAYAKLFVGGAGYACATLYPEITAETDPLGPENVLMFMTGPLTGTFATSTGRMVVCAKSPLTGIWGESNSGSDVCVQLKKAGYDGIIIRGKAAHPTMLSISDDNVELKAATALWGKNNYEIKEILKTEYPKARVISIGVAGEKLVKFATIASEERQFGRTGLGAVMGSKLLKAIVVRGTGAIPLANPGEFKEHAKKTNKEMMEIFTYQMFQELGTSGGMDFYSVTGELPVRYFRGSKFDGADKISGATLAEKYLKKNRHCFACPIGCGRVVEVGENQDSLPTESFEGPEYETIAGFGALIDNDDLYQIIRLNYICNDYGIDTISSSSLIGLLMDLVDQKVVSSSELDGIDLQWGNTSAVAEILHKIGARNGLGDLLAGGAGQVIEKFGLDPEQVAVVNNSHVTFHDMRASFPMALSYAISPHYGGSHNSCDMYMITMGSEIEDLDIAMSEGQDDSPEAAHITARLMEYRAFSSSAIMCVFANPPVSALAKYLELGLGEPWDVARIEETSSRILTLKRLMNLKLGHTPEREHIPKILLTPLPESGQEGKVPDFQALKEAFYDYMKWDRSTGYPAPEKIRRLGLTEFE